MKKILLIILLAIPNHVFASQLFYAVKKGNISHVKAFLNSGYKPDSTGPGKTTPLMQASLDGNLELVKLLLKHKANPSKKNISNTTALHLSARKNHSEIAKELLKAGSYPNSQDFSGNTPLIRATYLGNIEVTEVLLNNPKGADVRIKNNAGNSAIDVAIIKNYPDLLERYLKTTKASDLALLQVAKKRHLRNPTSKALDPYITKYSAAIMATQVAAKKIEEKTIVAPAPKVLEHKERLLSASGQVTDITPIAKNDLLASSLSRKSINLKTVISSLPIVTQNSPAIIPSSDSPILLPFMGSKKKNLEKKSKVHLGNKGGYDLINVNRKNITHFHETDVINPKEWQIYSLKTPLIKPIIKQKKTINSITKKQLQGHIEIMDVRTNEWLINTEAVPISLIDNESLGDDLLFNRRFTYKDVQSSKSEQVKPVNKREKTHSASLAKKSTTLKGIYIQLGVFSNYNNASKLSNVAKQYGKVNLSKASNNKFTKVLLGPFKNLYTAKLTQKKQGFTNLFGAKTLIQRY